MFDFLRRSLLYLRSQIPKPEAEPAHPEVARAFLMAVDKLPPGTRVREHLGDPEFTDEELEPAFRVAAEVQAKVDADPTYKHPRDPWRSDDVGDPDRGPPSAGVPGQDNL